MQLWSWIFGLFEVRFSFGSSLVDFFLKMIGYQMGSQSSNLWLVGLIVVFNKLLFARN